MVGDTRSVNGDGRIAQLGWWKNKKNGKLSDDDWRENRIVISLIASSSSDDDDVVCSFGRTLYLIHNFDTPPFYFTFHNTHNIKYIIQWFIIITKIMIKMMIMIPKKWKEEMCCVVHFVSMFLVLVFRAPKMPLLLQRKYHYRCNCSFPLSFEWMVALLNIFSPFCDYRTSIHWSVHIQWDKIHTIKHIMCSDQLRKEKKD